MRKFLNHFVVHASNIVKRYPGPKHADHDTMFLPGILEDIEEIVARQPAMAGGDMALELAYAYRSEIFA